jgi:glutamine amidotransferase
MIVVLDYGMGNAGSVLNMLRKLAVPAVLSASADDVRTADKLIVPGVGSFDEGVRKLEEGGLRTALEDAVVRRSAPVLGICLGLQLFTRGSEEGMRPGLGWLETETVRFRFGDEDPQLRVPHVGWNDVRVCRPSPLLDEAVDGWRFYFVHSYHLARECADAVAVTRHGYDFPAVVVRGNVAGTQFHPEKSHKWGLRLLESFARWSGSNGRPGLY